MDLLLAMLSIWVEVEGKSYLHRKFKTLHLNITSTMSSITPISYLELLDGQLY